MAQATLISTRAELAHALDGSAATPVLVFKHSLTCPVSAAAWQTYRNFLEERSEGDGVLYALVEIQNSRDVSNEVAERTGVRHESPQALLVKDGRAVWSASHWDLSEDAFREALASAGLA
jgi:bacillithiol system protein YtxJ